MSIKVACQCGYTVEVPDSYAGRSGTCKRCGSVMTIPVVIPTTFKPGATSKPGATTTDVLGGEVVRTAPSPAQFVEPTRIVPVRVDSSTLACPFCGEEILRVAKKCKHCSEILDPVLRASMTTTGQSPVIAASPPQTVVVNNVVSVAASASAHNTGGGRRGIGGGCGCLTTLFLLWCVYIASTTRPAPGPVDSPPAPISSPTIPVAVLPDSTPTIPVADIPVLTPTEMPTGWMVGDLGMLVGIEGNDEVFISRTRADTLNLIEAERRLAKKEGGRPGEMRFSMVNSKRAYPEPKNALIRILRVEGDLLEIEVLDKADKVVGTGWVPSSWLGRRDGSLVK